MSILSNIYRYIVLMYSQKHYYTVSQSIQDTHNEEVVGERWFWATEQSFIGEKKGLKCCSVVQLKIL